MKERSVFKRLERSFVNLGYARITLLCCFFTIFGFVLNLSMTMTEQGIRISLNAPYGVAGASDSNSEYESFDESILWESVRHELRDPSEAASVFGGRIKEEYESFITFRDSNRFELSETEEEKILEDISSQGKNNLVDGEDTLNVESERSDSSMPFANTNWTAIKELHLSNIHQHFDDYNSLNSDAQTVEIHTFVGLPFTKQKIMSRTLESECARSSSVNCIALCEDIDPNMFFATDILSLNQGMNRTIVNLKKTFVGLKKDISKTLVFANLYCPNVDSRKASDTWKSGKSKDFFEYPSTLFQGMKSRSLMIPDLVLFKSVIERASADTRLPFDLSLYLLSDSATSATQRFLERSPGIRDKSRLISYVKLLETSYRNLMSQTRLLGKNIFKGGIFFDQRTSFGKLPLGVSDIVLKTLSDGKLVSKTKNSFELASHEIESLQGLNDITNELRGIVSGTENVDPQVAIKSLSTSETKRPRLVFFAGLEGTGHHLWEAVLKSAHKLNSRDQSSTSKKFGNSVFDCELNNLVFLPKKDCWSVALSPRHESGLFCSINGGDFQSSVDALQHKLRDIARGPSLSYILNLGTDFRSKGQKESCGATASYPGFSGTDKALNKPDLGLLQRMCKKAGIDFQVIVLQRDTKSLVISDVWHRHFNLGLPKYYEEKVLTVNAGSLLSELEGVESPLLCIQYEDSTFATAQPLEEILGIDIIPVLKEMFKKREASTTGIPKEHEIGIKTLGRYNSRINKLCANHISFFQHS